MATVSPVRMRTVLLVLCLASCASTVGDVTTAPLPSDAHVDASETTVPETLFPLYGNAGYDVQRYDVDLRVDPATGSITSYAVITAVALADLPQLALDLGPMAVDGATVDGVAAATQLSGGKLVVTPATPVPKGAPLSVAVAYHGVPQRRADPSTGAPLGWIAWSGGSFVRDEPNGASTWLPTNDHPSDKAALRIRVTVPEPFYAVANGALAGEERAGGLVSTTWDTPQPIATYQVQVAVGAFARVDTTSPAGVPLSSFVAPGTADVSISLALAGQMLDFFSAQFGPYPFGAAGLIANDAPAGVVVEAQSRPLVASADLVPPITARQHGLLSTQMAHQWFGAAVTPARWKDIWLSEGFARYARWMWMQEAGLQQVDDAAANALARTNALRKAFGPPDAPTATTLFNPSVVDGGAVVLEALRQTVGDATFFQILRTWVSTYAGASVTTETFIDLASQVAGQDLTGFFDTWLSSTEVPAEYPTPPA